MALKKQHRLIFTIYYHTALHGKYNFIDLQ